MTDSVALTLAHIRDWDAGHLEAAAESWALRAKKWEASYTSVIAGVFSPGGTPWHGATADAAAQRVGSDRQAVVRAADVLHDAASVARHGAGEIRAAKQVVVEKVAAARGAGFDVEDDLSIVDTATATPATRTRRAVEALAHAKSVWDAADTLVATDKEVARRIATSAIALQDLRFANGQEAEFSDTLLTAYGIQVGPSTATPHLIYCYPSARPDFWWCESYGIGTGPDAFDSPWDLSGVA